MAISKTHSKKSPSQNPVAFYEGKQSGGPLGRSSYTAPDKLSSGAMREKIFGRKTLK